jgi:hypothetical protein
MLTAQAHSTSPSAHGRTCSISLGTTRLFPRVPSPAEREVGPASIPTRARH